MKLSNFEEFIDEVILQRGENYYANDQIETIKEIELNRYLVEVAGSDYYTVGIILNDSQEIVDTHCSCPYDWGEYCKHQVAAFFALRGDETLETKKPKTQTTSNKREDLGSVLLKLKKEELIRIIMDISEDHEEIEKKLLFKYSSSENEIADSKKLIQEFINQAKQRGFISWNRTFHALQGAIMTLEKAHEKVEEGETERAVLLSIAVLSKVVNMLQYCDDSSGHVGDVVFESFDIIDDAITSEINELSNQEKKKLFDAIIKEARNKRYDEWSEWRLKLLDSCSHFSGDEKLRKKLEDQLDKELEKAAAKSWGKYDIERVKLIQLYIIERNDGEEKAFQFIEENIHLQSFREKVICRLMEQGDYLGVIRRSKEGERQDQKYPGLVTTWRKYQLEAHEHLGNIAQQRELTKEFLIGDGFEYYHKLKSLYQPEEWEQVRDEVLSKLQEKFLGTQTFIKILKQEKLYEKMLQYCRKKPNEIIQLYPYLLDDYFEEVNKIFKKFIETEAETADNRKKYRKVCKHIKTYKKVYGETNTQKIIEDLKQKYERRPAFVDELGKVK
ncbi:SWIM zinc finger domain-containing protein [Pseudalkalibacillus sp. A8]|uniref:SWIM zinc finger family protein n=1 Tax=Pseudalkalibacillus sp. A8 TaxID=3382641 RepID=UPI0038B6665D